MPRYSSALRGRARGPWRCSACARAAHGEAVLHKRGIVAGMSTRATAATALSLTREPTSAPNPRQRLGVLDPLPMVVFASWMIFMAGRRAPGKLPMFNAGRRW